MKKSNAFFAILAIAIVAIAVSVVSCKKEKQESSTDNTEQSVQSSENMDEYLNSFKKKLLSAEKGEEIISLEQAEQDLCNLLNFDFGDANYASNLFQRDTIRFVLNTDGGMVDMSQLALVYKNAFDRIKELYQRIEFEEKSVLYVACSINKDAKDYDTANVQLILVTRGLTPLSLKTNIDSTDNWRVWDQLGKCDGSCVGDDHATIIEIVYRNNMGLLDCNGGRLYYTDVTPSNDFTSSEYPEMDPNAIHYNEGYRLWYDSYVNGYETYDHCVEYPEMLYYYNNFVSIMNNELTLPNDRVIIDYTCRVDCYVSINHPYMFFCFYTYAKPNCTTTGPDY